MARYDDEGFGDRPINVMPAAPVDNIASALDRIDQALEGLQDAAERTRLRVAPILHRHPLDESDAGFKAPAEDERSDLNQALGERADRLVRITNQIREMNERIDL